ncbi:hypothetical protein PanWU01x14_116230 [Parasponia andersonii]|uniref:Uncharacterized protein n=1 Tax=Parasponia andersonii TaxID=3476 RepID=A0A2P5CX69_PARAD|nr:hypothetical protein PanWU01x14_116230 [Parasponia andersonii]
MSRDVSESGNAAVDSSFPSSYGTSTGTIKKKQGPPQEPLQPSSARVTDRFRLARLCRISATPHQPPPSPTTSEILQVVVLVFHHRRRFRPQFDLQPVPLDSSRLKDHQCIYIYISTPFYPD